MERSKYSGKLAALLAWGLENSGETGLKTNQGHITTSVNNVPYSEHAYKIPYQWKSTQPPL